METSNHRQSTPAERFCGAPATVPIEFTEEQDHALDDGVLAMRQADAKRIAAEQAALDAEHPNARTWACRADQEGA
jgi:hypothetical protein